MDKNKDPINKQRPVAACFASPTKQSSHAAGVALNGLGARRYGKEPGWVLTRTTDIKLRAAALTRGAMASDGS